MEGGGCWDRTASGAGERVLRTRGRKRGRGSGAEWEGAGGGVGGGGGGTGGASGALPSQEGQQGPWRGWAQGAGGQGSRWQDTEPSRQRQRRQGSSGREKCSRWRAGTPPPGRGQPEEAAEQEKSGSGVQGEAAEPPRSLPGRSAQGPCLPGHWGQHSSGSRTGSGQGSGGQRRARHCTLPPCNRGATAQGCLAVAGRGDPPPWVASSHGDRLTRQRHCRQGSEGWGKSAPLGYSFPPKAQPGGRGSYSNGRGPAPPWVCHPFSPKSPQMGPSHPRRPPPPPFPYPLHLTIAVALAAGTRQWVGTGGRGAGPRLATGMAFLTLALLAGVSGVGEALSVHKYLFLQDAV